ncbi:MAG: YaaR family protein [Acetivibrionales bacterium]|jgi:uncharacterized protein YaaR (DUF327 family)
MKVRETMNRAPGMTEVGGTEGRKAVDTSSTGFKGHIQRIEYENYEERINMLVSRIVEQGEKLRKNVDIRELKIYKKLISEFLDEAVGNSLKFSKQNFLDRRGRHRVFAVIKRINKQLDALTEDVLNNEKDNIRILQRLDEIKGLVLDLVL